MGSISPRASMRTALDLLRELTEPMPAQFLIGIQFKSLNA